MMVGHHGERSLKPGRVHNVVCCGVFSSFHGEGKIIQGKVAGCINALQHIILAPCSPFLYSPSPSLVAS